MPVVRAQFPSHIRGMPTHILRSAIASGALVIGAASALTAQRPRQQAPTRAATARADTSPADTTPRRYALARFVESTSIRAVGPAAYSGRVTAIAVPRSAEPRPKTFYIGSAGGGVWKTSNGGVTWQ